jgi:Mg2+-importing ATPase
VFARVSPQEKHHIVKLLESAGHRVAFMGDGMNDAPALRAAHVGLAVSTAADIAKGAADIVLLKSDLHVIVDAIGYGREIFANVRKYIYTTLSANFGNFFTTAVLTLFIPFLPLFAAQILLLNLLSDFPLIAVATDEVDGEERSSPRTFNIREVLFVTVALGLVSSLFDFATFATFHVLSPDSVRTLWFMVSILTELLLVFSLRTWRPMWKASMPSLSLVVLAVAAGITALGLPFLEIGHRLFKFATPTFAEMVLIISFAIAYLAMTEGAKLLVKKRLNYVKSKAASI